MVSVIRILTIACIISLTLSDRELAAQNTDKKRPNILFILVDDQSPYDLKMYNPETACETPVLNQLANEGMIFDGAYHMGSWSGAVCRPSRTMIMTGRHVWNIPKGSKKPRKEKGKGKGKGKGKQPAQPAQATKSTEPAQAVGYDPARLSMPGVFNNAGYMTMRTCKNGNSYEAANALFQIRRDKTARNAEDEKSSIWHGHQVMDYLSEREAAKDNKPFLIYYGFSHPHDPRWGRPDLLKKYGATNDVKKDTPPALNEASPKLPENYLPKHPFHHGHPGLRDEVRVQGVWERRDPATIRNELGREFACNELIDQQVGRVLKKLEAMGELDNTFIFYTADHGMAIGRHGLQGKQNLYEHTWRVPFFVKGPGIKPGTRVQGNVYLMDVLATMCDLTGVTPPEGLDSKSMKPVLMGEKEVVRDTLYGVYCGGTKPGMRAVRKGDWKLIKYDVMEGQVRETQLFNLKDNRSEYIQQHHDGDLNKLVGVTPAANQINLAGLPEYKEKLAEMEALLLEEMKAHKDPYRLWNQQ